MDYHGQRFLTVSQFRSHAESLKVRFLSPRELEFYERHCLLLPAATTRKPAPHALAVAQDSLDVAVDEPSDLVPPEEWRRLQEYPWEGRHAFDREQGLNPFLVVPDCTTYEPWDERRVPVTLGDGHLVREPTVERYYGYWQVHVVELLRQATYYKRDALARQLPETSAIRAFYRIPEDAEWARSLQGKRQGYEVLTLFDLAYSSAIRDPENPFDSVPEITPAIRSHLGRRTQEVLDKLGFDEEGFFSFVSGLVELRQSYLELERGSLAGEVERDLALAQRFARYAFDYDWDDFVGAVRLSGGQYYSDQLRRLDPVEAARDGALENLKDALTHGFPVGVDTDELQAAPEEIVDFCTRHELFEVLSALADYSFTDGDLQRDRFPGFLHRRLRPLALAVEQLLHGVLDAAGKSRPGDNLTTALQTLGEGSLWVEDFNRRVSQGETSDKQEDRSLDLRALALASSAQHDDPEQVTIARTFIVAAAARNLVSHRRRFLASETTRPLAGACVDSILLVWLLARRKGLLCGTTPGTPVD